MPEPKSKKDIGGLFKNGERVLRLIKFEERPTFTLMDLDTGKEETWTVGSTQDNCFKRLVEEQ